MRILSSGTSGIVVEFDDGPLVYKVQLDEIGSASYYLETRSDLKEALMKIDPSEKYFVRGYPANLDIPPEDQELLQSQILRVRQKKNRGRELASSERLDKPLVLVMRRLVPIRDISKLTQAQKKQIEDGLWKLQSIGWMHNDIHSWNILWDPQDDLPKIIDFGEAQKVLNHDLVSVQELFEKSIDTF